MVGEVRGSAHADVWAVQLALRVLSREIDEFTWSGRGPVDMFVLRRGDHTEAHHLLRRCDPSGVWTVPALRESGVLAILAQDALSGRQSRIVVTSPLVWLGGIAGRAGACEDVQEFLGGLAGDGRRGFDQIAAHPEIGSVDVAWRVLRSLRVDVVDEQDLRRLGAARVEQLLTGDSGAAMVGVLRELLAETRGRRLDFRVLVDLLSGRSLLPVDSRTRDVTAGRIGGLTDDWSATQPSHPGVPAIGRGTVHSLSEALAGSRRLVLLTGSAGAGKSWVLHEVVSAWSGPKLAVRVDRWAPFAMTADLGDRLGLGMSPVSALSMVAADRACLLVVDQLDAVSLTSGRNPDTFDAITHLLAEARAFPEMRVVLACRSFDADDDHRIRAVAQDERTLRLDMGELTEDEVAAAVTAIAGRSVDVDNRRAQLFNLPLHLVMLADLGAEALELTSSGQLFAAFWRHKRRLCRNRRASVRFNDVVAAMAEEMSRHQRLYVTDDLFDEDELIDDADVLVSEHVLTRDGRKLAFFHESFFDYAFARAWIRRRESLVEFLCSDEQELFRRAQVRQILSHLREAEPERYLRECWELLTEPRIRELIRSVGWAFLGGLPDPSEAEGLLVVRLLERSAEAVARARRALRNRVWFERFDTEEIIEQWLRGADDEMRALAVECMAAGFKDSPGRVTEILQAHADAADYPQWIRWFARMSPGLRDRGFFELLLASVRKGHFEGFERDLWSPAYRLGDDEPGWAVELVYAHLGERPGAFDRDDSGRIKDLDGYDLFIEPLLAGAKGAPSLFCELLVPYLRQIVATTACDGGLSVLDRNFTPRFGDHSVHSLGAALVSGSALAIRAVASADPTALIPLLETLASDPYDTSQWLLYQGFIAAPEQFAPWAAEVLSAGAHRLSCGYLGDQAWTAGEVLTAITQYLNPEAFSRLEASVLSLDVPDPKRYAQRRVFTLLSAMEGGPVSDRARRRLGELRRMFKAESPPHPSTFVRSGIIDSPIPRASAKKMSDDQWLRAMAKHTRDHTDWSTFTGGAGSLAAELAEQVSADPVRFAALAMRLTADVHPAYANAILRGLRSSEGIDVEVIHAVVRHVAGFGKSANDRHLSIPLAGHWASTPQDIVAILVDRVRSSPHPPDDDFFTGHEDPVERLETAAINCARGCLAADLAMVLTYDTDGGKTALVLPHLAAIATDPVTAVRVGAASLLHGALRHGRAEALAAVPGLIDANDALLGVTSFRNLMLALSEDESTMVTTIAERMLRSQLEGVNRSAGRLAAYMASRSPHIVLLEAAVARGPAARVGVAGMLAELLAAEIGDDRTLAVFLGLLHDPDDTVRKEAAVVVPLLRGRPLRSFRRIISGVIHSPTFKEALPQLLITLKAAPDQVDDLLLATVQRFIEAFGRDVADLSTRAAGDAREVSGLLVRAYAQAELKSRRRAVLNLLDQLELTGAYGTDEALQRYER